MKTSIVNHPLNSPFAPVVSGERKFPIGELLIKIMEVPGRRTSRVFRMRAMIIKRLNRQSIPYSRIGHQLPDAPCTFARERQWVEATFHESHCEQFGRH